MKVAGWQWCMAQLHCATIPIHCTWHILYIVMKDNTCTCRYFLLFDKFFHKEKENSSKIGAGMAQWWEYSGEWWQRSPPTNVSLVRFPDAASYVGRVCCWFSSLLQEVFPRVLRFSPLLKNQHFQIPVLAWKVSPISAKVLGTFDTQIKVIYLFILFILYVWRIISVNFQDSHLKMQIFT